MKTVRGWAVIDGKELRAYGTLTGKPRSEQRRIMHAIRKIAENVELEPPFSEFVLKKGGAATGERFPVGGKGSLPSFMFVKNFDSKVEKKLTVLQLKGHDDELLSIFCNRDGCYASGGRNGPRNEIIHQAVEKMNLPDDDNDAEVSRRILIDNALFAAGRDNVKRISEWLAAMCTKLSGKAQAEFLQWSVAILKLMAKEMFSTAKAFAFLADKNEIPDLLEKNNGGVDLSGREAAPSQGVFIFLKR